MESTARDKRKAPAPPSEDASSPASVPEVRNEALPEPAVAGSEAVEGAGRGDDEQVEKFYALLANIRALRGMYRGGEDGGGSSRKRAGAAELSWSPTFRMEDFRDVDDPRCARKRQRRERQEKASDGKEEEGEVLEEKDDRVSASQLGIESKA